MSIAVFYEYYLPAYKAGGPIQSISNMTKVLTEFRTVYIICSNRDLDGAVLDVSVNQWVKRSPKELVYYFSGKVDKSRVFNLLDEIQPEVIFINGLYSLPFTVYPLMYDGGRKILSARGMLHPGALSQKSLKKRLFLNAFKLLGLHKKCEHHATTIEEAGYIKNVFGKEAKIWTVSNLPNVLECLPPIAKHSGELRMISVSLISPMKNILLVIRALKFCRQKVTYHIYGPVKDAEYWALCKTEMKELPQNIDIAYKGEVSPSNVSKVLSEYQVFILPSKSENFGHAIYEAMSAGKPVITSHNTPWNNLRDAGAGRNINPENQAELIEAIEEMALMGNDIYRETTLKAKEYITHQYDTDDVKHQYIEMFS